MPAERSFSHGPTPAPLVFLQTGVPGLTPYAGGSHLWTNCLDLFQDRGVECLNLPGCAGEDLGAEVPTVDKMTEHVARQLSNRNGRPVHLVGHDVAALVALMMAMDHPQLCASVTLVASAWAAPSGDGVDNLTLRHPPQPLWSAPSQRWTLERLSQSHHAVSDQLVKACTDAAGSAAHRSSQAAMKGDGYFRTFVGSAMRAKFRFFQLARGAGLTVPIQVIAGQNDPMVGTANMLSLFRIAAQQQRRAHFHIINRSGSFPFLDQPNEFARIVQAFADGLEREAATA